MQYATYLHGHTLRANDIRQHLMHFGGKGEPLILIPGIMTPCIVWDFVADRLGAAFDTYLIDVRGRGLSEGHDDMDYSLDAYAADVNGLIKKLGFDKAIIVGHSMGARIALRTATKYPDVAKQIVMIDPPVSGPGRRRYPVPLESALGRLALAKRGELWEASKDDAYWSEHTKRVRAEWTSSVNEVAVRTTHRNFHEEDIFPDFPKVKCPASLMVATRGGTILDEDVAEIKSLLPSLVVDHVPDAGHMIPMENPEGCFASLSKLLGKKI